MNSRQPAIASGQRRERPFQAIATSASTLPASAACAGNQSITPARASSSALRTGPTRLAAAISSRLTRPEKLDAAWCKGLTISAPA
ncbi:hypothetical protein D3C78_1263550 [compost metagenome]